jgi:hypothetical protein
MTVMTSERKFKISWAADKRSWSWEPVERTWRGLTGPIAKAKIGSKDEAECWSPALFKNNRRGKHNSYHIDLLVFDSDCGNTKEEIAKRLRAQGWKGIIISTSSHLTSRTKVQASACDKWCQEKSDDEGSLSNFLIEKKHMLPRIAAGAREIRRFTEKQNTGKSEVETELLEVEHQPCPKYRVVLPLSRPWRIEDYPDPETARRAWEAAYTAGAQKLGLPFDETCRGVDRMFFFTRVPADRLALAESLEVEGAECPALDLAPAEQSAEEPIQSAKRGKAGQKRHRSGRRRKPTARVFVDQLSASPTMVSRNGAASSDLAINWLTHLSRAAKQFWMTAATWTENSISSAHSRPNTRALSVGAPSS